ncbi:TIGR02594 family protein [Brevundimonas sp. M1A4_2e]
MVSLPWINTARSLIGTREIPGPKSNPTILAWAKALGRKVGIAFTDDDTPWCGLYIGHVMSVNGYTPPDILVRASEWSKFGVAVPVGLTPFGAIAVFTRKGGGHVGFIVGQDATTLHILGGNQSNAVNVTRIAKDRLSAVRWPAGVAMPKTSVANSVFNGQISTNEA